LPQGSHLPSEELLRRCLDLLPEDLHSGDLHSGDLCAEDLLPSLDL
jgi:hypothetical protein